MKRRQFTQTLFNTLVASSTVAALSGCGFKMRGSFNYPFKSIYTTFVLGSTLGNEFKRVLGADSQINLITNAAQADKAQVVLDVLNDQREKVVVGVTAAGQVREFQLRVRLKFKLRTQDGREIIPETELLIQRDIFWCKRRLMRYATKHASKAFQSVAHSRLQVRILIGGKCWPPRAA